MRGLGAAGLAIASLFLFNTSCREDLPAEKPVYFQVDRLFLQTNYDQEGSAHNRITTAWLFINNEPVGAFELPFTVPVLMPEGESDITIYPGVNLNGIQAIRAIYDAYEPIRLTRSKPEGAEEELDTIRFTQEELTTTYRPSYDIFIVEDFDQSGVNLEALQGSDTAIIKVSDPDSVFSFTPVNQNNPEPNGKAGLITLQEDNTTAEFGSVAVYDLPPGLTNVYLEATYRSNVDIGFGLIALLSTGQTRRLTTRVFPKEEWSMIHMDLITEYLAEPNATGYKIYITARKPSSVNEARIFLDNLKLCIRP